MGVLDKFLDAIKLNDDYDDDGFLDDDLLDEEEDDDFLDDDFDEKPKKKFFDKSVSIQGFPPGLQAELPPHSPEMWQNLQ